MLDSADQIGQERTTNDGPIIPRATDFAQWYQDIIAAAELVDQAPVRGCYILRPNGYFIWESIQRDLDARFKQHGVQNAYFPLLIPMSFIMKEAEHVEGFAPELAVVTHGGGEALEEPLVVRPTSETVIWSTFRKWIRSHRDLPLLLNQWCNVMRWEKRPRAFLRTAEFLWQEGHTAHATAEEARQYALENHVIYYDFLEECLGIGPIAGEKPPHERFPGAVATFTLEPMMQDGRALQTGTSHDLGDTFGRAFDVTYQGEDGQSHPVFATSWGMSTRTIGGVLMVHGDDRGAVFPPTVAPVQVAIVPVPGRDDASTRAVETAAADLKQTLTKAGLRVTVDSRPGLRPGAKFFHWERHGTPLRLEIGPRDVAAGQVMAARRDTGEKMAMPLSGIATAVQSTLDAIQMNLRLQAHARREARTYAVDTRAEIEETVLKGYAFTRWCESRECAADMQAQSRGTIRCFPFEKHGNEFRPIPNDPGPCGWCGNHATRRVLVGRSY
ncbi:MAG: proline--tRNA ligase [Chloroflexi bacterium]|nr:MAG: proline--tRNA ligase [Chloroflexota bacterium]